MYVTNSPMSVPMQLKGQSSHKVVLLAEGERQNPSIHTEPTEILFFPFSVFLPQKPSFILSFLALPKGMEQSQAAGDCDLYM